MLATQSANRLINETSPYLLQHAHNPVDWYPWGEEAFEKARLENKPVFVSIGYSTCHWCHVMAHESFENEEIADILNAGFVSIKVDREERPDIDEVYMHACQALTGSGGWPLSIFLTPDNKPFFAGTYFPRRTAFGRIGFDELLNRIVTTWKTDHHKLLQSSEKIVENLGQERKNGDIQVDETQLIEKGFAHIQSSYEPKYGGFSQSPKFPTPHYLLFLLQYWKATGNKAARSIAEETLEHMYRGGIFDHVGYGFSRYSTDNKWLVPHFEKMLYDNAMLLLAYTECYAATGKEEYRFVARKVAEYVLRDMTSPEGGFYSAEDADSEGVEGKYYVWDYAELEKELTANELKLLETEYGVTKRGNFEGKNIFNRISTDTAYGNVDKKASSDLLKKLFDIRSKRIPPFKDTKISASWNGLMIRAMAHAGAVLGEEAYIDAAKKAADFVLDQMVDEKGMLQSTNKDGKNSGSGFLDSYANMVSALAEVYIATRQARYLNKAVSMAKEMARLFWDEDAQRFYMTGKNSEALFMRPKDEYDGAMPSGNSSAAMSLVLLAEITADQEIVEFRDRALHGFLPIANTSPGAYIHFLSALMLRTQPHRQVVIAADPNNKDAEAAYQKILQSYLPFTTVIYYDKSKDMDEVLPWLVQYRSDAPFAGYICENFACRQPVYNTNELINMLML